MNNFEIKSNILILLFCGLLVLGLHHLTKFADRYSDKKVVEVRK